MNKELNVRLFSHLWFGITPAESELIFCVCACSKMSEIRCADSALIKVITEVGRVRE